MQALKQILEIPASRELVIQLPAEALAHGKAEVIVLFQPQPDAVAKQAMMREAMNDPLFLADMNEVMEDFKYADAEGFRTLNKQRLQKQFGTLIDPQLQEEVLTALCFQLGITR